MSSALACAAPLMRLTQGPPRRGETPVPPPPRMTARRLVSPTPPRLPGLLRSGSAAGGRRGGGDLSLKFALLSEPAFVEQGNDKGGSGHAVETGETLQAVITVLRHSNENLFLVHERIIPRNYQNAIKMIATLLWEIRRALMRKCYQNAITMLSQCRLLRRGSGAKATNPLKRYHYDITMLSQCYPYQRPDMILSSRIPPSPWPTSAAAPLRSRSAAAAASVKHPPVTLWGGPELGLCAPRQPRRPCASAASAPVPDVLRARQTSEYNRERVTDTRHVLHRLTALAADVRFAHAAEARRPLDG